VRADDQERPPAELAKLYAGGERRRLDGHRVRARRGAGRPLQRPPDHRSARESPGGCRHFCSQSRGDRGRLFAAAQALAEVAPENAPLAYSLVEFAMQHHGIIEPSPHLIVIWGPADKPSAITDKLEERLPQILRGAEFSRLGVGSARRGRSGEAVTVLAFQASFIETRPIPRSLPDGGTIRIDGTLRAPFADPQVYVTGKDGGVAKPSMTRLGSSGFRSEVPCDDHHGKLQIEITALDASGATVMANFPVWCHESPPDKIVIQTTDDDTSPVTTAADGERRMTEKVNDDRRAHGLAPLQLDAQLSEVARAHSQEMLETGVVAHISPTTGSAVDRVVAGGINSAVILENVARAYGVSEAEQGLMNSPGHRANILSDKATHLGVGIAVGEEVAGRRELFVTQLFVRRAAAVDVEEASERAHRAVQAVRPLAHDERLSDVAGELARSVAAGEATEAASKRVAGRLRKMKTTYSTVTTVVTAVADIDAFQPDAALADPSVSHFGLGIAQGVHSLIGDAAIYVVLLLAKP
jgi:uncharacterized protein YkwD